MLQVGGIDELGSCDVGAVRKRSADWAAEVVDEHVVVAHAAFWIQQDAIEDIDHRAHLHAQPRLLEHFPREPFLEGLPKLEAAAGKAPLPRQRFEAPFDDHNLATMD